MKSPTVSPLNSSHSQNSSLILCTECTKGQVDKNGYPGLTSQKKTEDSITRQYPKRGSFEVELNDASISLEVRWNTNKNEEAMNGSRKKLHVTPPPPYDNLSIKETTTTCPQCGATNTTTISENNIFSTPNCELSKGQKSNRKRSYQLATGETTITQNEMSEQEITYKETSLELDLRDGAPKPNELHVSNNSPSSEAGSSQLSPHERTTDSSSSLPADGENELLSVFPCLPPIRHSTPEKPDSSNCAPSVKYFGEWIIYVLSLPWLCIFTWSVPDCSKAENKKWFMLSFVISIAWIAGLSYLMVEVVEKVGCLLGIDTYTMGLVVIAIGTSVPDAISSVLVAKAGYADMAVSNAIGSNVFDINLGLGFPFLFASIVSGKPVHLLTPFQSCLLENLPLSIRMIPHVKFGFILLLILFICLTIFFLFRFKLNRTVGLVFFSMYFIFLIYAFVQEKSCYAFFC